MQDKLEKTSEATIEKALVRMVEKLGGKCIKLEANFNKGLPDRLVLIPGGHAFFCEVKRPKGGTYSKRQLFWQGVLVNLNFETRPTHNYREIENLEKEILKLRKEGNKNE